MGTMVTHAARDGSDFQPGLRTYFQYRDTGIQQATNGAFMAHVIRAVPGDKVKPEWHRHDVQFQMFFVLKGWIEFEYEDIGRVRMEEGATVYQPPMIGHREIEHSDDLQLLEIISPAVFRTESLEKAEK